MFHWNYQSKRISNFIKIFSHFDLCVSYVNWTNINLWKMATYFVYCTTPILSRILLTHQKIESTSTTYNYQGLYICFYLSLFYSCLHNIQSISLHLIIGATEYVESLAAAAKIIWFLGRVGFRPRQTLARTLCSFQQDFLYP